MPRKICVRSHFLLLALLVVGFAVPANAQFRASVQGTVTDSAGAVVEGASITITNKETARSQQTQTSRAGFYRFSNLPPGHYTISAEQSGFKKSTLEVEVRAEEVQGFDIALTPGAVSETVLVEADAAQSLQTENANVDRSINTQEILRLPQFGRDPYELARLTPGVFGQGARNGSGGSVGLPNTTGPGGSDTSIFQTENQVPISANGQRISANNFEVDGVSVNSLNWGGAAVVTPNQESVKEVRVLSSAYSAEFGRNSGAQVLVVSQNGTNNFHGSGFFKYNDPKLNAFNKYGGPVGASGFAPLVRVQKRFRQFGGSIGGPLHLPRFGEGGPAYFSGKDRLFFFFSYEGLRQSNTTFSNQYVETPQYRQAILSARANGVTAKVLSSSGIAPRIVSVIPVDCAIYGISPAARCRVVSGGLDIGSFANNIGQYVGPETGGGFDGVPDIQFAQIALPSTTQGNQYNARIDYIRGKDTLTFSSYITPLKTANSDAAAQGRPGSDTRFEPTNSSATLTYVRIISASLVNEARLNATRFFSNQLVASSDVNYGIPRVEVEGLPIGGRIRFGANRGETSPGIFAQNQFEFRDALTWVRGNMAWKFGGEFRREQDNNNLVGGARPLYSFTGLFNLANDTPVFEAINTDPATGRPASAQRYFRTNVYGFFAQDDWKVRPNLTLNLGLRYEYFSPLREKEGRITNLVLGSNGLSNSRVEIRDQLFEPDRNNFAPRLGFAYSPRWFGETKDKLVVRGGFGIAYNRVPNVLFSNTRGNSPFFARNSLCCGNAGNPFARGLIKYVVSTDNSLLGYPINPALARGIDQATNGVIGTTVEIYGTTPELPNSYVYTYSLDAQYDLPFKLVASLGYQGSAGHKLIRIVPYNFVFTPTNPRFDPVFIITPDVNSNYNAMLARLQRRFSNGFDFDAQYRWSKSIDTLSYEGPGFVTNQTFPQDQRFERGPSDFDVRHYFTLSSLYEVQYFRKSKGVARTLLDGWQINSIVTAHSGLPWTPLSRLPELLNPGGRRLSPVRPIAYLGGNLTDSSHDAFTRPFGNFPGGGRSYFTLTGSLQKPGIGRNSFRGPDYFNIDLSLVKRTYLSFLKEGAYLDLRANFFNAFNLKNLQNFAFGGAGTIIESPDFGRSPGGTAGRVVEFQARFNF